MRTSTAGPPPPLQHAGRDLDEVAGHVGVDLVERGLLTDEHRLHHLPGVFPFERTSTPEALVQDHAERPDVGASVDVLLSEHLLG